MYVLFGGGALAAFCASAAQHFFKLAAGAPVPVPFFGSSDADGTGSGASSNVVATAAGVDAAAGAEGRGGGGSSFLQPVADRSAGTKNPHAVIAITERSGFMVMFLA